MTQIAELAKFIGRHDEVNELAVVLENAAASEGQVVFISGEAGIGKTRFINEVQNLPMGQRFNWLTARCIYQEGTDPYLPFFDALKVWLGPGPAKQKLGLDDADQLVSTKYDLDDLAKIPVIGPKLTEDPSLSFGSFMVKESKSEFCLQVFSTLVKHGRKGLCITRIPPQKLKETIDFEGVKTYWLSSRPDKSCIPPSLTKLSHEITQYVGFHPNSVVILDGLEYLISHLEFNKVLRYINELIDTMAVHKSILLLPINPLTIDPKQLALLERNMNTIDMITPERPNNVSIIGTVEEATSKPDYKFNEEQLQQGRNIMFESITQQILDIASTKPVALFIDDLHWADEGALHLLHYLARAIQNQPVVIICAYREEDLLDTIKPHPLRALLDRLIPEKLLKIIKLSRFNELETGEMILSLFQDTTFPDELVGYIHNETEGNPLFIDEIVRTLVEGKVIKFDEIQRTWSLTRKIPEIGLPDTVKEVLLARINRLQKDMRLLLEIASVLGVEFEYNILGMVSKLDEELLVTHLDDLMRYQLLIEQPTKYGQPITYRFTHNKICEVLYSGLGQSHKRLLHSKAASAIEDRYKNSLDSVLYELAQHCYHSGDHKRGLKYTIKAGEKALLSYAPEKARMFYQWALDSLELEEAREAEASLNKKQHLEVLTKLCEICTLIGEWDEALKYTDILLNLSSDLKEPKKQADAHNYAGRIHIHRSSWSEAKDHFENALKIAKDSNYTQGNLEAYHGLGEVYERTGEYTPALEYYQDFMELAKKIDSQNDIARGYKAIAMISTHRGEYNEALEYYQKCIELLTNSANHTELAKAYTNIGIPYFELGEFDKVIECNEKCIELASRTGDIRSKGLGFSNAAEVYARKHEFDQAIDYANKALDIFKKLDEKPLIGLVWINYGIIYKNKQDWEPSRYYFEKSLLLLESLNVPYFLADCTHQFGLMLADQGTKESLSESRENLQKALSIFKELGAKKFINVISNELEKLPP